MALAWWWRCVSVLVAWVACCSTVTLALSTCNRAPAGVAGVPKRSGDNGFSIKISGNPAKYVPGEVYTVSLKGFRIGYSVQRFTSFLLVVEAVQTPINLYGLQSVGTFQLFGDALTMHSDDCPNAITQTSSVTKTEVQVLWTAPPAGSGCVRFRALVVESRDVWYMDDGELTKELCEEVQESDDTQPPVIQDCCACDEAKYEVTFEGLWSRHTHHKDFPTNEWLTHFSDVIGASHSADYRVWEYGGFASDGLRQVAEWGSTRALEGELKTKSEHIRTIIKARGLWHPNVNGKTFAVFRVDNRHHLMSLVSMLGPTPDWIVGVSALELCLPNCTWVQSKTLNLYPWDAGTDSGVTYESANMPSMPREKIHRITNSYPNDPEAPFYDPTGLPMKPLARLTIERQRVYSMSCSDARPYNRELHIPETSDDDAHRPACNVTSWSEFSPCSRTCGQGIRQRSRNYVMPLKAQMMTCQRQLMEKELCDATEPFCPGDGPGSVWDVTVPSFDPRVCKLSSWTSWTPCLVACGSGLRMRNRHYLDRMGRKKCNEELVEKQMCIAEIPRCENQEEQILPECQVTQWTDFSPCSVTCGQGHTTRTRTYLVPAANQDHCSVKTLDQKPCDGERRDCSIDPEEAEEVCLKQKVNGPCRGFYQRFYFDQTHQRCMGFRYGGCRGNRNNFDSYDECTRVCEFNKNVQMILARRSNTTILQPTPTDGFLPYPPPPGFSDSFSSPGGGGIISGGGGRGGGGGGGAGHGAGLEVVNCMMTPWSEWGPCPTTCGKSHKIKSRMIKVQPQNGGRRCPKKTMKRRRCKNPRCPTNGFGGLESRSLHRDPLPESPYVPYTSTPPPPPYRPHTPSPHLPYENHEYIAPALFNPPDLNTGGGEGSQVFRNFQELPPVDCVMSEWGPWSPCTHSCGPESLQQRSRNVVVEQQGNGVPCGDRYQRRFCTLPPCSRPRPQREPWNRDDRNPWQP